MNKIYKGTQETFRSSTMRTLVDFKSHGNGIELYHAYQSAALFSTRETNVAAALGISALSDIARAGITLSAVMPQLGSLVISGLTHLATDIDLWRFDGMADEGVQFRKWMIDGSAEMRERKSQALLEISERSSSRFLLLSDDHSVSVADEISNVFGPAIQPFTIVLDAWALANKMKAEIKGAFFVARAEEGK